MDNEKDQSNKDNRKRKTGLDTVEQETLNGQQQEQESLVRNQATSLSMKMKNKILEDKMIQSSAALVAQPIEE